MTQVRPKPTSGGVEGAKREQARVEVLEFLRKGYNFTRACEAAGIKYDTWKNWRRYDPDYELEVKAARELGVSAKRIRSGVGDYFDPSDIRTDVWPFTEFRRRIIGRPVPAHQVPVVDAWEDRTNQTVIWLAPPSGGKDTTAGDFVLHGAVNRRTRMAWLMENSNFSKRRLGRLEQYLYDKRAYVRPTGPDCTKPTDTLMESFGRFKWEPDLYYPDETKVAKTKWNQNEIYFIGRDNEADPNLWATGIDGALYGARIDEAVMSDIFTRENQWSATERAKQIDLIFGTLWSRLDDNGRALFINTRVASFDNMTVVMDRLIGDSPEVRFEDHGHTTMTKFANGVALIVTKAIWQDESGEDCSYWPERFSLESYLESKDGSERVDVKDLSVVRYDELAREGWERSRGLYEIRGLDPDWFETAYQQNPPAAEGGEFTPGLLDHCDDFSRTVGVAKAGEMLFLGVDPARTQGAAWVVWGSDGETFTVIDWWWGKNLGVKGIRDSLLVDPILRYRPRYTVYEGNREQSVVELPQVKDAVAATGTKLTTPPTHAMNRGVGETRVAAMSLDMAEGRIRFPAATPEDREQMKKLKAQFINWDRREQVRVVNSQVKIALPDDGAMAAWVAWVKMKKLEKTKKRRAPRREVAPVTKRMLRYRIPGSESAPVSEVVLRPWEKFFER